MEHGLFPDDAQIRRITQEASLLGGAGYAVLLQICHPGVAQGVRDHSDFASRPLGRLRGTLTYVYGLVHGTEEEAERIGAIVRAMHRRITGPDYDALDPDLLLWVAATLYASGRRVYGLTVRELSPREDEEFYQQASVYATALGCPREYWPATRAEFDAYWDRTVAGLRVTDAAREIARDLFRPPGPLVRPLAAAQRFLSTGLMPPRLRGELGLAWTPLQQRRFDRLVRVVRAVYPRLPMAVRTLPKNACMRNMRRRAARGPLHRGRRRRRNAGR